MKLGPLEIEHPFILAPMAGITTSPFRRLMRRLGSSIVISELVSANGLEYSNRRTMEMLRFHPEERPLGLQIFGENEERLVKAAQAIERLGADFVDLNLGCPVPKITKNGAGCALTRDPVALGKILSAMVKAVNIPVTIKIRLGWDAQSINAHDVVAAAADAGVGWVAIHGRTRAQGYSGQADWARIAEIKARAQVPILGNGDLITAEVAVKRLRESGVDAVLIGRAALRNPFIFEQAVELWKTGQISEFRKERLFELLRTQRDLMREHYPERVAMLHARKFLAWYAAGYPGCHEFRRKVFTIPDPETLWGEAQEFFEKSIARRDMKFLNEPFLMGGHG